MKIWEKNIRTLNIVGKFRFKLKEAILRTEIGNRFYLKFRWGGGKPKGYPEASWRNSVLKTPHEWRNALDQVNGLDLPPRLDPPKNWDALAALDCILKRTSNDASILDGGADLRSVILPWLILYGYRSLIGINLIFQRPMQRGPRIYEFGDITQTRFNDSTFDAITCLSVIEHGVNLRMYFREMARILKPNGILITSCDYWVHPVDTKGHIAYGSPIHVFDKDEVVNALDLAKKFNLQLTEDIDLDCEEKPVKWKQFGLEDTFSIFTLLKRNLQQV